MIYLDSSALVKLVRTEAETPVLRAWLDRRKSSGRATSSLARVEVVRAIRDDGEAAGLPLAIRSLDAIHLASAMDLGDALDAFVAYDKRLLVAAEQAGLPIASPGAP